MTPTATANPPRPRRPPPPRSPPRSPPRPTTLVAFSGLSCPAWPLACSPSARSWPAPGAVVPSSGLAQPPDALGRPAARPGQVLGVPVGAGGVRGRPGLDQGLNQQAAVAEQPDPGPVRQVELDRPVRS